MRWNKNDHNEIGQERLTEEKESKRVQKGTRVRDSLVQTLKDLMSLNWKLLEHRGPGAEPHRFVHDTSFLVGTFDVWSCWFRGPWFF